MKKDRKIIQNIRNRLLGALDCLCLDSGKINAYLERVQADAEKFKIENWGSLPLKELERRIEAAKFEKAVLKGLRK